MPSITNKGKNNSIEIIRPDGTAHPITTLKNSRINISGDNNHIKIYEPIGKLHLNINVSHGTTIILAPSTNTRRINIIKESGNPNDNNVITIGKNFYSTGDVIMHLCQGSGNITIGTDCLISWGVEIRVGDWHTICDRTGNIINYNQDVIIGNHVWCGSNVMILKGSIIPDGCVIGTRSLVTHKFNIPNTIIAGSPAKIIKENIIWRTPTPARAN